MHRKFYRALLLAYPTEFRREYGGEMETIFAERFDQEPHWRLWLEAVADATIAAPREHLHILKSDLSQSLRLFKNAPGFAAIALLVMALGIGATTTVFSLTNAVLLRSLPYRDADRLVYIWTPLPQIKELPVEITPSYADVFAWRDISKSFTSITSVEQRMMTLNDGARTRIGGAKVLGNFFSTMGSTAQLGRTIDENDDQRGKSGVVVISDALWRARFGGTADALGKMLRLDKRDFKVIGIMPPEFGYPHSRDFNGADYATRNRTDVWIPLDLDPKWKTDRSDGVSSDSSALIGRLAPNVRMEQARTELAAIETQLVKLYPGDMQEFGFEVVLQPFVETAIGPVRPLLLLLAGAVCLILLMAGCNLAGLLMTRAAGRIHEMGVRTALGAARARLVRLLLTESMMLAVAGSAVGAALSFGALKIVTRLNPGDIPRLEEATLDGRVLLFGLVVSLVTGLAAGLFPAWSAARVNVSDLLRQGGRGIAGGSWRARNALIVTEVALAVVLLAGAGLLVRSYVKLQGEDKGYAGSTLTAQLVEDERPESLSKQATQELDRKQAAWFKALTTGIQALPGVQAVGAVSDLPLSHSESVDWFEAEGYPNRKAQSVNTREITGEYLRAMQVRLIAGRFLNEGDVPNPGNHAKSILVSESFAKLYFAGRPVIGSRVRFNEDKDPWSTVVGIVGDVRHSGLEQPPRPTIYWQNRFAHTLAIRSSLPPDAVIPSIHKIALDVNPALVLTDIQTMSRYIEAATSRRRFQTVMLTTFAAIAVILALVGLYGLLSYSVRQRTAETGVRMAMGATRRQVLGGIVRYGLTLTMFGLAIGLIAAYALTRSLASMLYGVSALDPVTFVAVPAFILLIATIACLVPGWKAARTDPISALRHP